MACKYHSCLPSLPRHSLHQKHDIDTAIPWFHAPAASSAPHGAARCPSAATARAAASSSSSWFRMSWGSNICHHPWDENEWISHGIWSWAPRIACWSQRIYIYICYLDFFSLFFLIIRRPSNPMSMIMVPYFPKYNKNDNFGALPVSKHTHFH